MEYMEKLLTLGLTNAAAATVLAIVVGCSSRVLARRPAWLHCLWLVVLLKLVTPPLLEIPILGREASEPGTIRLAVAEPEVVSDEDFLTVAPEPTDTLAFVVPAVAGEAPDRSTVEEPFWPRWRRAVVLRIAVVWMLGTVATLVLAAIRVTRFRRLLRQAYSAPEDVQDQVRELAGQLGLRHPPNVLWIDVPLMPMLWALGCRPRLIIPRNLWKTLTHRQRSLLLAHELAHLRRGDHLVRLFELIVTALFWWLPVVWWARYALRDAEEQCCDAWVVWAFPDDARTYAETLLDTVDFLNPSRSSKPLLACGFGRAHHLRRRLTMIMLGTTPRRLGWGSALLAFALSAFFLPLAPSWAQKPDDAKPVKAEAFAIELTDDSSAKPAEQVKSEVHVVVATDGDVQELKADSLDKAAELIKQRIEKLAREGGDSHKHLAHVKALKQVLLDLEKAKAKTVVMKLDGERTVHVQVARAHALDSKMSAETKAKIDSAKARVDALRKELDERRHQLQKAEQELRALTTQASAGARMQLRMVSPARVEERRVVVKRVEPEANAAASQHHEVQGKVLGFTIQDSGLKTSDRQRLESLEKKLEKLLDEVAILKKHEKKAK